MYCRLPDQVSFRLIVCSCRQFAHDQIGGTTANEVSNENVVKSAAVGTALGAAVGVAADAGNGAATGLLVGSLIGVNEANASSSTITKSGRDSSMLCSASLSLLVTHC
jgi:hypothetical protein